MAAALGSGGGGFSFTRRSEPSCAPPKFKDARKYSERAASTNLSAWRVVPPPSLPTSTVQSGEAKANASALLRFFDFFDFFLLLPLPLS